MTPDSFDPHPPITSNQLIHNRMKKYNILNNSLGWLCFVVAAVTYLMTLEPTASFWDCPEFITQGYKLEVGHPPGNPIFMLTARFFVNFAFGDVTKVALMVNAMSAILSAATILLLFWTITHLVKKLIVKDNAESISMVKMLIIFGSGICGALMYTWSDTFWFSAVEGEVYAFSSFCTALVFWLILKWENRADRPGSDKYLILIAYVIGISIAVHLLNLLCIPAIVLVIYFKKKQDVNVKGSLIALLISFVIVAFILYGLVPGLINVAQGFELFFVNTLGMSFNVGVLIYAVVTLISFTWTLYNVCHSNSVSPDLIKISFLLSVLLSGILMIGNGWLLPLLLIVALTVFLFTVPRLPMRWIGLATMSIFVMFVGYSSYALLLVRSSAHTPMNQNSPDNVFALASYLNREQYGDRPLIYGETLSWEYDANGNKLPASGVIRVVKEDGTIELKKKEIRKEYAREVKTDSTQPDRYHFTGMKEEMIGASELNMLFPRMYSSAHINSYDSWLMHDMTGNPVSAAIYQYEDGTPYSERQLQKASLAENLRYFFVYQLNHMYWRYFMWNFAGRQNDIQGQGEPTHGNWISGIPVIDNMRLGDQSLLPDELGKGNKGHNVFFMLPLILGIFGFVWQSACGKKGIEQFWVVFFLFFMTGIAIVLYLNQTPDQPRERDYAFAGSFYAYAIWVGMGVAGLWHYLCYWFGNRPKVAVGPKNKLEPIDDTFEPEAGSKADKCSKAFAVIAAIIGLIVPLQVVSQTWDDHDRSGRYTARDYGMNYLNSLDDNAIIFTYGDNDTFPLWYAQEVEGVRTDVKVVNLSYLTTDWYINQLRRQSYDADAVDMQITPEVYAYDAHNFFSLQDTSDSLVDARTALAATYRLDQMDNRSYLAPKFVYPNVRIPANATAALKSGRVTASDSISDITLNLRGVGGGIGINSVMVLDILNSSAENGWNRPIYFATTVPSENYIGLQPYFKQTGLAYEVVPTRSSGNPIAINTDKMYRNITERFRWGSLDKAKESGDIYLDETVRRMASSNRNAIFDLVSEMIYEIDDAMIAADSTVDSKALTADRIKKINTLLELQEEKIPTKLLPLTIFEISQLSNIYSNLWQITGDEKYRKAGLDINNDALDRFAQHLIYYDSLRNSPLWNNLSNQDHLVMSFYRDLLMQYGHFNNGDLLKKVEQLKNERHLDVTPYLQR